MQGYNGSSRGLHINGGLTSIRLNGGVDCQPGYTPDLCVSGGARIKKTLCVKTITADDITTNYLTVDDLTITGSIHGVTPGLGTVTSVGLAMPSIFSVSGSPITSSGTLTATLVSETANTIFAAPNGSAGTPTFRTLVPADIPLINLMTGVTGILPIVNGGTGTSSGIAINLAMPSIFSVSGSPAGATGTLTATLVSETANSVFAAPNGLSGVPTFRALVPADIPLINLATGVTGVLPVVNGGTGTSSGVSIGLTMPSIFSVSGSPANATGAFTATLVSETANTVFAAPNLAAGIPTFRTLVSGDLPLINLTTGVTGILPVVNGGTGTSSGISVGLALPSIFTVTGSPVTSSGVLTATLASETANTVFAAPNGSTGTPTFRALVAADIPPINLTTGVTGILPVANGGTGSSTGAVTITDLNTAATYYPTFVDSSGSGSKQIDIDSMAFQYIVGANGNSLNLGSTIAIGTTSGAATAIAVSSIALGTSANAGTSSATDTIVIGRGAGNAGITGLQSVGFGSQTLSSLTSGNGNTAVGYSAASSLVSGSNVTCIGNGAQPSTTSVSNEITLGNSSVTVVRSYGAYTFLSDARDKKDIRDLQTGLDFVQKLQPREFVWNMRDGGQVDTCDTGFIAQELLEAQTASGVHVPQLVQTGNPEKFEICPNKLIPVLVKAIQELSAQNAQMAADIAALKLALGV